MIGGRRSGWSSTRHRLGEREASGPHCSLKSGPRIGKECVVPTLCLVSTGETDGPEPAGLLFILMAACTSSSTPVTSTPTARPLLSRLPLPRARPPPSHARSRTRLSRPWGRPRRSAQRTAEEPRQVPAGYYRAPSAGSRCILDVQAGPRASGAGDLTVLISPNDRNWRIRSNSACGTWTVFTPQPITSFSAGRFYIGAQVQPGSYRASSTVAGCELEAGGSVRASGAGDLTVLITTSDWKATSTAACGIWQRISG